MEALVSTLDNISSSIVKEGVTSFLATTMTMPKNDIIKALNNIGNYNNSNGANLLGIHLEGPFISRDFCGAQDPKNIVIPTEKLILEFI